MEENEEPKTYVTDKWSFHYMERGAAITPLMVSRLELMKTNKEFYTGKVAKVYITLPESRSKVEALFKDMEIDYLAEPFSEVKFEDRLVFLDKTEDGWCFFDCRLHDAGKAIEALEVIDRMEGVGDMLGKVFSSPEFMEKARIAKCDAEKCAKCPHKDKCASAMVKKEPSSEELN